MRNLSFLIAAGAALAMILVAAAVWYGAPSGTLLFAGLLVAVVAAGIAIGVTRRRRGEKLMHRPGGP